MSGGRRRLPESITSSILAVAAVSDVSCLVSRVSSTVLKHSTRAKHVQKSDSRSTRGEARSLQLQDQSGTLYSGAGPCCSAVGPWSLVFSTKKFGAIDLGLQLVVIRPNRESCGWKDSPVRNPPITGP